MGAITAYARRFLFVSGGTRSDCDSWSQRIQDYVVYFSSKSAASDGPVAEVVAEPRGDKPQSRLCSQQRIVDTQQCR